MVVPALRLVRLVRLVPRFVRDLNDRIALPLGYLSFMPNPNHEGCRVMMKPEFDEFHLESIGPTVFEVLIDLNATATSSTASSPPRVCTVGC